jgi:hypothetical protein
MPNHIQNKLRVYSENTNDIKVFLENIKGEKEVIDFDKIIPMPNVLNDTESSTDVSKSLYYYLLMTDNNDLLNIVPYKSLFSADSFNNCTKDEKDEMMKVGEKYFSIYKECGAFNWYDWRCDNWGTKWNAYESYLCGLDNKEVLIEFQTAWNGVPYLIEKLVSSYPNLSFEYKFADEDMGYNCGVGGTLDDGTWIFEYEGWQSDNAMDLYIECHKENKDDFYKDELGRWHNRNWE